MDFYHSWIYVHLLNTATFVWIIVIAVFSFNFAGLALVWFVMNSKSIPILNRFRKKDKDKRSDKKNRDETAKSK